MSTKDFSSKQEKLVAEYFGWQVVSGSGARDFSPGDVKSAQCLGECKTHVTRQDRITFYKDVWDKISKEAKSVFKSPVLIVDDGTQKLDHTFIMYDPSQLSLACMCTVNDTYPKYFKVNVTFEVSELQSILRTCQVLYVMVGTEACCKTMCITTPKLFSEVFGTR